MEQDMRLRETDGYRLDGQADRTTYALAREIAGNAIDTLGREACAARPGFAAHAAVLVARENEDVFLRGRREAERFEMTVTRFILNALA